MNDFIDSLNIPFKGEMRGNQYIINLDNSNDFSRLFSTISMNDTMNLDNSSRNIEATKDKSEFTFTNGEYEVFLQADYNDDVYSCTIEVK